MKQPFQIREDHQAYVRAQGDNVVEIVPFRHVDSVSRQVAEKLDRADLAPEGDAVEVGTPSAFERYLKVLEVAKARDLDVSEAACRSCAQTEASKTLPNFAAYRAKRQLRLVVTLLGSRQAAFTVDDEWLTDAYRLLEQGIPLVPGDQARLTMMAGIYLAD